MVISSDTLSIGAVVVVAPELLKVPLLLNRIAGDKGVRAVFPVLHFHRVRRSQNPSRQKASYGESIRLDRGQTSLRKERRCEQS